MVDMQFISQKTSQYSVLENAGISQLKHKMEKKI